MKLLHFRSLVILECREGGRVLPEQVMKCDAIVVSVRGVQLFDLDVHYVHKKNRPLKLKAMTVGTAQVLYFRISIFI